MTEQFSEDPWWDEVCRDWIDQEINRTGSDIIHPDSMPDAVHEFVKRLVKEQYFESGVEDRMTGFAKMNLLSSVRIIDVDLSSAD